MSWAAVAFVMGSVNAEHPDVRTLSAAPGALRAALSRALGEGLRIRARQTPLAVVLDDAHLADSATLDGLEYATLQEGNTPLFICVTARPALEPGRPAWGSRARRSVRHELEALDPESSAMLARRLLAPAENIPKSALAKLFDRTQGVPRLLVELIRGLKRDGLVRRTERGTSYYLATEELEKMPDLPIVQWSASREVEALAPNLAAHARLASVLGSKFTSDDVERVLRILERNRIPSDTDLDAAIGVQRLVEAGLLVRHRTPAKSTFATHFCATRCTNRYPRRNAPSFTARRSKCTRTPSSCRRATASRASRTTRPVAAFPTARRPSI